MNYLLLLLFFIPAALAQPFYTTEPYPSEGSSVVPTFERSEEARILEILEPETINKKSNELRLETKNSLIIGYQFITSWLPSKKTLSYTYNFNNQWSLEAEYAWASIGFPIVGIDLGSIKEKRYSLQARRFVGNSFNFSIGTTINDFSARLGSDFLDRFGNEINSNFRVQNLGLTFGMGNRWQWQNGFTLGIDWLRLNIPFYETKLEDNVLKDIGSEGDRDDLKKVIWAVNHIPTFVLFGINLGYSF